MTNVNHKNSWTEDFIAVSGVLVPVLLILLSIFTPKDLVDKDQKEELWMVGITLLIPGGFRALGKKTEVRQNVQNQEMNLASSADYMQYNPPRREHPNPYLSRIDPNDQEFLDHREHQASSPYRVVSPDDDN